jgi:diguanylate cyclase (GGDEF)-like protein
MPDAGYTYVLMLTARDDEERIVEAFAAGADDYVVKPGKSGQGGSNGLRWQVLRARVRAGQRMIELREQVEHEKRRLKAAALTDVLTQLPNRRYAMKQLEQEAARLGRSGGRLSVMMLDIDYFKRVNDTYGHDVGDHVLREVARVLRRTTREGDVVCRLGGEEFLVICSGSDLEHALQSAERLRSSIEAHEIQLGDEVGSVTASIGVAEMTDEFDGIDPLLKTADRWVYLAKAHGRNRVCSELDDRRAAS